MTSSEPDQAPHNLPGVGTTLRTTDTSGRPFVIVRRHDGAAEIYVDGAQIAEFDQRNARAMGAFMSGRYLAKPELTLRLDDVLGGLSLDCVTVEPKWAAAGMTIEQLAVRRATGVTIVAILRGSVPIIAPHPTTTIMVDDELVVACRAQDLEPFSRFMTRGR